MRLVKAIPFSIGVAALLAPALPHASATSILASPAIPSAAQAASRELDFTPTDLRLYQDPRSGRNFWYLTYEVVNRTGRDQRFAPRIDLLTDEGRVVAQGAGVPSQVVKDLKELLQNPLLEDQFEILGEVLQGREHAKTGLVVFEASYLEPTELTVFVQGLSRETKKAPHPKSGEPVTLRKSLRLDYLVPGDPKPTGTVSYPVLARDWTFR